MPEKTQKSEKMRFLFQKESNKQKNTIVWQRKKMNG